MLDEAIEVTSLEEDRFGSSGSMGFGYADTIVDISDITTMWRPLTSEEIGKVYKLIEFLFAILKEEAKKVGKDLEKMRNEDENYKKVLRSVMTDIIIRAMQTRADQEPMTQFSQSALGYTVSGTYLVPGGGIFIKKSELARLGLRTQRYGGIELC